MPIITLPDGNNLEFPKKCHWLKMDNLLMVHQCIGKQQSSYQKNIESRLKLKPECL